jgi:hypothetical protein
MNTVAISVGATEPTFCTQKCGGEVTTLATVQIPVAMMITTLASCHHGLQPSIVPDTTDMPTMMSSGVVASSARMPTAPVATIVKAYAANPTTWTRRGWVASRMKRRATITARRLALWMTLISGRSPGCVTIQPTRTAATPAAMRRRHSRARSSSSRSPLSLGDSSASPRVVSNQVPGWGMVPPRRAAP